MTVALPSMLLNKQRSDEAMLTYVLQAVVPTASALCFAQVAQSSDPLSGGAGWMGAGLLGVVLAWLLLLHLPAKDKQMKEMIEVQAKERLEERLSREKVAETLKVSMAESAKEHTSNLKEFQLQHIKDAERDREAFMNRNKNIEAAIQLQTKELQLALGTACRFQHMPQPQREVREKQTGG